VGITMVTIIYSDHNTIKGGLAAEKIALEEYNNSIVVIPAMEYS
jgi:predicted metal-dependent phosphoesterase TrpH